MFGLSCTLFSLSLLLVTFGTMSGQPMPVFLGRNTPPVAPGVAAQTSFGTSNNLINPNTGIPMMSNSGFQQTGSAQQWAPGEPRRIFPSTPQQWMNSCQRTGCRGPGLHCVFWGSMCPNSIRRVPCRCERGCRVDTQFIPFGQSKVMDRCNNVCTCRSREGLASCTARRC